MMIASEVRKQARQSLTDQWVKSAILILIFFAVEFLINFFLGILFIFPPLGMLGWVANILIIAPLIYGIGISFIKIKRKEEVGYFEFFSLGFSNFEKVWRIIGACLLQYLPYIICLVCSFVVMLFCTTFAFTSYFFGTTLSLVSLGFVLLDLLAVAIFIGTYIALIPKLFSLALCIPIAYDNPEMSGKEIVATSITSMQGNRFTLFYLYLTFIGWAILSAFTFCIGYFFLVPYMFVSFVCFYETICKKNVETAVIEETKAIEGSSDPEEQEKKDN